MTQINLLPWRELRRDREIKIFLLILIACITGSLLAVYYFNVHGIGLVKNQLRRNQLIQHEINKMDAQLNEMQKLRDIRAELMAKISLVQQLQSIQRSIIHLFDELSNIVPSGVYFKQIEEEKNEVYSVVGYAQSNQFVSNLMKNIEINPWLQDPILKQIKRKTKAKNKTVTDTEFQLTFVLASKL